MAEGEVCGPDAHGCLFIPEILSQAGNGVGTSWIGGADFLAKSGEGGVRAPVVVEQRVEDVEGVLGRLTSGEGAEFHDQEGPGFADADG